MWNIAGGQKPQLPTPDQLSPAGIDFLNRCFEREPAKRGTAAELLQHDWVSSGPDGCFGVIVGGNFADHMMEKGDERGVVFEQGRPFEKSESESESDSQGCS